MTVSFVPWATDWGAEMPVMRAKVVETRKANRERKKDAEEQCMAVESGLFCEEVANGKR